MASTVIPATSATTWLAHFRELGKQPTSVAKLVAIAKHLSTGTDPQRSFLELEKAGAKVAILVIGTDKKLRILHNFNSCIGDNGDGSEDQFFALLGAASSATTMALENPKMPGTKLFQAFKFAGATPQLVAFEAATTKEDLATLATPVEEGEVTVEESWRNGIAIPPFLAFKFMEARKHNDPGEMCLLAYESIQEYSTALADKFTGDAIAKANIKEGVLVALTPVIQWLFIAAQGAMPTTTLNVEDSVEALLLHKEVHEKFLSGITGGVPMPGEASNTDHRAEFMQMVPAILQAYAAGNAAANATTGHDSAATKPKSGEGATLPAVVTRMVIRASERQRVITLDDEDDGLSANSEGSGGEGELRDGPVATLLEVLSAKTAGHAAEALNQLLVDRMQCSVNISLATVAAIRSAGFRWASREFAGPLSIFALGRPHGSARSTAGAQGLTPDEVLEISNQALEGKGWSEETSKKAATPSFSLPWSTQDVLQHLQHFQALLVICFGARSRLARWASWIHTQIRMRMEIMNLVFEDYPSGPTYLCAAIDMAVQDVLHTCASEFWKDEKVQSTLRSFTKNLERDVFEKRKIDWVWLPANIKQMLANRRRSIGATAGNGGDGSFAGQGLAAAPVGGDAARPSKQRKVGFQDLPPPPPGAGSQSAPPLPTPPVPRDILVDAWPDLRSAAGGNGWRKFIMPKNVRTCPKVGGSQACLKYWLQGSCSASCERKSTHVGAQPPAGFREKFHAWAIGVRDGTSGGHDQSS